jgi:hypothetical protein
MRTGQESITLRDVSRGAFLPDGATKSPTIMIAELQAGYTAAKTAFDIASRLQKMSTDVKINEAIIGIQNAVLAAQEAVMAANEKINELSDAKAEVEKQLVQLKDWSKEASRYELKEVVPGILLYALRGDLGSTEPFHYLCPNCFENQKKSIL